jgi:diaminopimelate epimerase
MDASWPQSVRRLCDRHFGIGADGILIIRTIYETDLKEMIIFNSDGSRAEMCMNGSCCSAHFLYSHYNFEPSFNLKIGHRQVKCRIIEDKIKNYTEIETTHEPGDYKGMTDIKTSNGEFSGHIVSVGNPHFIIFQECDSDWLASNGKEIECHQKFPLRTNVEFVFFDDGPRPKDGLGKTYRLLMYERGCGITLACGSGAAATLWALFYQGIVKQDEHVTFIMPGGNVVGHIDLNKNIVMQAQAEKIFEGVLKNSALPSIEKNSALSKSC